VLLLVVVSLSLLENTPAANKLSGKTTNTTNTKIDKIIAVLLFMQVLYIYILF
jgi:hypothetical protein